MKTQQNRIKKLPKEPRARKKLRFEDGVKAALIAAAVICAAVLGVGGFFVVRPVLSGDFAPPVSSPAGEPSEGRPAEVPAEGDIFSSLPGDEGGILPELDQAIRDLEAADSGGSETPAAGTAAGTRAADGAAARAGAGERKALLALVIDDAGNNLRELDPFLVFPGPLTIAVLPGLPNSVEAARRVRSAKKELFLHQPMEPLNGQDPGPGAIRTGMDAAEVKAILVQNLNEIGPVTGFNNHEGSRATMDPAIMRPLLELSRDSGLYFLDSRTIADTVGPRIARELGLTIAQRDIFLDNEQDRESILTALEAGCKKARQTGSAVLIGHAWSPRLAGILTEMYPVLVRRGFTFVTLPELLHRGK
ncbi:MAG: divergent polysaccharide deacetylase family protein [Spirochaetaceae bacterium]|nr:divergent polysaccharide deacetylase family protein [Spirochaetaceae bacterium]